MIPHLNVEKLPSEAVPSVSLRAALLRQLDGELAVTPSLDSEVEGSQSRIARIVLSKS